MEIWFSYMEMLVPGKLCYICPGKQIRGKNIWTWYVPLHGKQFRSINKVAVYTFFSESWVPVSQRMNERLQEFQSSYLNRTKPNCSRSQSWSMFVERQWLQRIFSKLVNSLLRAQRCSWAVRNKLKPTPFGGISIVLDSGYLQILLLAPSMK